MPRLSRGRSASRRAVEWIGWATALATDTATTNSVFILLTAAQLAEYIHPTVVRVRGTFGFSGTGNIVGTAGLVTKVTVGMAIVTDQAAAAAATPIAAVDLDADWFLWDTYFFSNVAATSSLQFHQERVLDSKSMRRIAQPDNAALILAVSTTLNGVAGTLKYRSQGRILMKGD